MVLTKETAERPGGSHILLIASRSHPGSLGVFVKCSHIRLNKQKLQSMQEGQTHWPDSKPSSPFPNPWTARRKHPAAVSPSMELSSLFLLHLPLP